MQVLSGRGWRGARTCMHDQARSRRHSTAWHSSCIYILYCVQYCQGLAEAQDGAFAKCRIRSTRILMLHSHLALSFDRDDLLPLAFRGFGVDSVRIQKKEAPGILCTSPVGTWHK